MTHCPNCGSRHIASRRTLFRHLVTDEGAIDEAFAWYDLGEREACPPKSLFVVLLSLSLLLAAPAVVVWFVDAYPTLPWLAGLAALLVVALVLDARLTYRRYRHWAARWLCGSCRSSFQSGPTGR